jgi:hypothetical protein
MTLARSLGSCSHDPVDAVIVLSPQGSSLVVGQVIVDDGGVLSVWASDGAGGVRASKRPYADLDDAVGQNSRATTTALRVTVASVEAAKAMVGRAPPPAETAVT